MTIWKIVNAKHVVGRSFPLSYFNTYISYLNFLRFFLPFDEVLYRMICLDTMTDYYSIIPFTKFMLLGYVSKVHNLKVDNIGIVRWVLNSGGGGGV